ncbi:MAG: hypothetical protein K2M15_08005 [Oscillospiraceae bacterium]|nr:hypothetical protein [Oscillospiraceae bacterium]MDE7171840.1 hypothetical protein [Oscillospiraceae bacterium]
MRQLGWVIADTLEITDSAIGDFNEGIVCQTVASITVLDQEHLFVCGHCKDFDLLSANPEQECHGGRRYGLTSCISCGSSCCL